MKLIHKKQLFIAALSPHDGFHDHLRAAGRPLPSWNAGKTKQSIVTFV